MQPPCYPHTNPTLGLNFLLQAQISVFRLIQSNPLNPLLFLLNSTEQAGPINQKINFSWHQIAPRLISVKIRASCYLQFVRISQFSCITLITAENPNACYRSAVCQTQRDAQELKVAAAQTV